MTWEAFEADRLSEKVCYSVRQEPGGMVRPPAHVLGVPGTDILDPNVTPGGGRRGRKT